MRSMHDCLVEGSFKWEGLGWGFLFWGEGRVTFSVYAEHIVVAFITHGRVKKVFAVSFTLDKRKTGFNMTAVH